MRASHLEAARCASWFQSSLQHRERSFWCAGSRRATWPPPWDSLTLMFQREVAERIVAVHQGPRPTDGSRSWPQWRCRAADRARPCPPKRSVPPPKVSSAVVHLRPPCPRRGSRRDAEGAGTGGGRRRSTSGARCCARALRGLSRRTSRRTWRRPGIAPTERGRARPARGVLRAGPERGGGVIWVRAAMALTRVAVTGAGERRPGSPHRTCRPARPSAAYSAASLARRSRAAGRRVGLGRAGPCGCGARGRAWALVFGRVDEVGAVRSPG